MIHHSGLMSCHCFTDVIHVGTLWYLRDSWTDDPADRRKTCSADWNLWAGDKHVDVLYLFHLTPPFREDLSKLVCVCVCESLYPRGHCLWVQTAPTQVLSVASLIYCNYVSQPAHSQSHTYIDSLSPWLFLFFPFFFSFFFFQETRVVVASGWLAAHVCVYDTVLPMATTLQRHRSKDSLHGFRVKEEKRKSLRDLQYSERGFQCKSCTHYIHLSSPAIVTNIFLVFH